ncbi:SDR family NAD(P)-dependent oxidoreductase [Mycolicibacterium aichiense]|uniref:SDR family NAD(P)-dependent oxidoreductase n=1 Tax=Mycolicibacterium aichiense TaxID=1799 RepID=UPI003D6730AB
MPIKDKTVLVTGANRGIGRALTHEALRRGASCVYAATRGPFADPDDRIRSVTMDVTDREQIRRAAEQVGSLDILINNAGVADYDDLSDRVAIERHLAVNLFGTYDVVAAFLPKLLESCGTIVNNSSLNALAPLPLIPAYSISKAATFNLTQSLRALLAPRGVRVHAILTGPVDTDMSRGVDIPKATPEFVATAVFDAIESGHDDIFPDPMAQSLEQRWRDGAAKALENHYAALLGTPAT